MNGNDTQRLPLFVSATWITVMGLAALPIANILRQLSDDFWLDEIITWWIVDSSFQEVFTRATEFHSQSPFYYWILWLWSQWVGKSEVAFRSLSLLFFGSAMFFFARSLRVWLGGEAALAVFAICASSPFVGIFVHARPYSLAFLFVSLAFAAASRFCARPSWRELFLYTFLAVLTIYAHYVYAIAMGAIFLLMWMRAPKWRFRLLFAHIALGFGITPLLWHMHLVVRRVTSSNWMQMPTLQNMADYLQPPFVILLVALLVMCHRQTARWYPADIQRRHLLLSFLAMWFMPPFLLLALSHGLGAALNAQRYIAFEILGIAGALTIGLTSILDARIRLLMLVTTVAVGVIYPRQDFNYRDSWRVACRRAVEMQASTEASEEWILYDGMNESGMTPWIYSASRREFLLAPLAYCGAEPRKVLIAPFWEHQFEVRDEIVQQVSNEGRPRVYIARWGLDLGGVRSALIRQGWTTVDESAGGILVGVLNPPVLK